MMMEFIESSMFFGVFISLLAYEVGLLLKKKFNVGIMNPLLIAIVLVIVVLLVFKIPYASYNSGAKYISYLLTPATVALAIPLYNQFSLLKKNVKAILLGIFAGVIASLLSVSVFALLFHFTRAEWITFLPKSITTAIGMGVSEELGGYVSITVTLIILTGVFGNISAEAVCKMAGITDPVAKGIAIGSASHAVGTSKAMEIGEVEGAMSSLSIVVSGIITVVLANILVGII